ncbi:MAG: hypothetical protein ABIE03_01930 [Patescibacteria group bacterium]|nr:hypothetical protein [Patescibacteria group bacterium]
MKFFKRLQQARPELIILIFAVIILGIVLTYEYKLTNGNFGAPLDDVFIHFQFSKNLVAGNGFSFNPDQPTPGSTSPGWTILISFFYLFIKDHLLIAKSLSAIFFILSGILTYKLAYRLSRSKLSSISAAVFTLFTGRFAWASLSGMEVTLFTALLLLFLLLHITKKNKYLQVLVLGLASTVRPEGYLIFIFFMSLEIFHLLRSLPDKNSFFTKVKLLVITIAIYSLLIGPYLIFSYRCTGSLLPNTFKSQDIVVYHSLGDKLVSVILYLLRYSYLLFIDYIPLTIFVPLGLCKLFKMIKDNNRLFLILLIVIGFPIFASIFAPNLRHHGRYTMPFIPLYAIIGVVGIEFTAQKLKIAAAKIKIFVFTTASIYLILMLSVWASTFGWNVKNINDMHVKLGNWILENTKPNDVIALNDIGAMTYISDRKIIDMMGLVSPEILETRIYDTRADREEALWKLILEKNPEYIIIFPSWFPNIAKKEELKEVYKIELDKYAVVDGEMIVYKINSLDK